MKYRQIAVAAALAVTAVTASATATDWGAHDPLEFGFGFAAGAGSSIMDTFAFTLGTTSTLTTTVVTNDLGMLDLTGATVFLYSGMVGSGTFVSGFAFDSMQMASSITPLMAGSYYYEVMATVAPTAIGGSYTITSQVAAVPEPETYALMLAGLGAIGFIASRRRSQG